MVIIKSDKFILRPYKKGDEESLQININSKEVSRFMSTVPFPYKTSDAHYWIKHNSKLDKSKNKKEINFAIEIDNGVVGGIGLMHITKNHKAEIGYWLGKKYWGKGIMTEAIKIVLDYAFNQINLKRIYAKVFIKNKPSVRILEKNKFKLEGILKKELSKKDKLFDVYIYAKTK